MSGDLFTQLSRVSGVHTGDIFTLPGPTPGRPGEVVVVLVAETPSFLGTGLLIRPPSGPVSYDDRVSAAQRFARVLKECCGNNVSPIPIASPVGADTRTAQLWGLEPNRVELPAFGGALVHFARGPEQSRKWKL